VTSLKRVADDDAGEPAVVAVMRPDAGSFVDTLAALAWSSGGSGQYLAYYNFHRAHTGRLTQGRAQARDRLRCPQGEAEVSECRYISGSGNLTPGL